MGLYSDQVNSTNYITNKYSAMHQRIEYLPFGEVMFEERKNMHGVDYLFSAKELDAESGFYYFGARYYDPRMSIFLSVDPLADKYPGISPYCYAMNNPLKFIDPTGMEVELTDYKVDRRGYITQIGEKNDDPDRLFATDHKGKPIGNPVDNIPKGILDKKQMGRIVVDKKGNESDWSLVNFGNEGNKAEEVYDKIISNTDVEWSLLETKSPDGESGSNMYLITTHLKDKEVKGSIITEAAASSGNLIRHEHNHHESRYPSYSDINIKNNALKGSPDAQFYMRHNGNRWNYNDRTKLNYNKGW